MTAFQPLERISLADDLAQRITRLIQDRGYQSGHRLPAITSMAKQFGVGHPTVREALRKLEVVGVVDIRHGSGVYVKDASPMLVTNPIHDEPVSKKLLVDLIEARTPIELQSVGLAALNATDEQLRLLMDILDEAERNLEDAAILSETNMRYHLQIANASGNTVLFEILKVLSGLFRHEQRLILDIHGSRRRDHEEHKQILGALAARDADLAVERMRAHLDGVRQVLVNWDPEMVPVR